MSTKPVTVEVRASDIAAPVANKCYDCPLAKAINRVVKTVSGKGVSVGISLVRDHESVETLIARLPEEAIKFRYTFDMFGPAFGLCRVQWEGPWTAPGVPIRVRYRHTHWVAVDTLDGEVWIFDVNCMCVGGWVQLAEWRDSVVTWLLKECEPQADGKWHLTHVIEVNRPF